MRKRKQQILAPNRENVYSRDGKVCRYCGTKYGPFALDHVYPESKGGETTEDNLVVSCKRCNTKKSSKVGTWPAPIGYHDTVSENKRMLDVLGSQPHIFGSVLIVAGSILSMAIWYVDGAPDGITVISGMLIASGLSIDLAWFLKR